MSKVKSWVWNYAKRVGDKAYCDLCEENSNNEFSCVGGTTGSVLRHLKNIHNISNQQESNKTQRCVLYNNMSELTHIVIIITSSNITYNIMIILIFNNFFSGLIPTLVLVCYSYIIKMFSINQGRPQEIRSVGANLNACSIFYIYLHYYLNITPNFFI